MGKKGKKKSLLESKMHQVINNIEKHNSFLPLNAF